MHKSELPSVGLPALLLFLLPSHVDAFNAANSDVTSVLNLRVPLQSQSSNNMQKHKSSSSFTPFIDPRLLQVSPSTGSALNNLGECDPVFEVDPSAS